MKKKVRNLPEQLINDLENQGLSYKDMMNQYGLTRWGARKLGDHNSVTEDVSGNHEKLFYLDESPTDNLLNTELPVQSDEPNSEEIKRSSSASKQTITNNANKYLRKLEKEVKNTETPETSYEEPDYHKEGATAIIHETDPHFSAHVRNRRGETIYDTETADQATQNAFKWYYEQMLDYSYAIDEIVLLLGGDLVEGENIYEGQAHKVEDRLDKQIETARKRYFTEIKSLRHIWDAPIKIVCVSGNHGDLPVTSSSNADDIIYSQLEDMVNISELENIKFVKATRSDGVTFNYRGWKGYLTHGEHYSTHIGTSSPQSDWYATKDQLGFDAAWRGHYHTQKQEDVGGAPVFMTNSRKPGDDYTDKISVFGETGNAIYFATDREPVKAVRTQSRVLK